MNANFTTKRRWKQLILLLAMQPFLLQAVIAQSPGGINTNLKVWLKADAGISTTANGAAVSVWNDQSGGNRTHSQATTGKQPTYVGAGGSYLMNYNPAVHFGGISDGNANNDFLQANNYLASTDAFHVFSVTRTTGSNGTNWQVFYAFTADVNNVDWYTGKASCRTGGAEKFNTTKSYNYALSSCIMPKSGNQQVIWNGSPQTFGNTAYSITTSSSPTFTIGADRNNSNPMVGDIQEVIVYSGTSGATMTAAQIAQIQSYLAFKYGISLDAAGQPNYTASNGSTQYWTGASNTGYQNNIFGLGRDDNSALNQRQSYSFGDSSISIYLGGSLAPLNSANAGAIAADNSFLALGDNGLTGFKNSINYPSGSAFQNTTSTSALNTLSNRIWKVQATTQTSWTININLNKYATATYVLVSSSPTFSLGTTRAYPITTGTAANVTVNNGEYIAMAGFATGPGGVGVNLAVWLRADAGTSTTTNGAPVADWFDQSGNNRTHLQTIATNQPTYVGVGGGVLMNYNPALRFDGSNDYLSTPKYNAAADAVHVFGVGRLTDSSASGWRCMYAQQSGTVNSTWRNTSGILCPDNYISGDHINTFYSGLNHGLVSYLCPRTGNGNQQMIWNGSSFSFANVNYNPTSFTANYRIGEDADGSDPFLGCIQEIIVYANPTGGNMTANEVQRIQSYLAIKYGVSLNPAGQPDYLASNNSTRFWTGAVNVGYQNNIFGLGRDDNSSLAQAQAFSYGDSSISVYLGNTLAPLNADNSNTIPQNNSFLMLGDNNLTGYTAYGSYSPGTAFSNGSIADTAINFRSNRIWKAQTTTQASWTVSINTNKFTGARYVLVSANPAFPVASTRIYPVTSGAANEVVINDGEYISMASLIKAPGGVTDQLSLWVKSDDADHPTPTASWKDHSLNANPVEMNSGGSLPLTAANTAHNFYPYFTGFSATNAFHDVASSLNPVVGLTPAQFSMFSAVRPTSAGTGRITGIDDNVDYSAEPGFSLNAGKPQFYKYSGTERAINHSTTVTANKSSVISYIAANPTSMTIALDGKSENLASAGTFNFVGEHFWIGYGNWAGTGVVGPFPGDIMEVIWHLKPLTTDEASRVSSYLALKNGVTLGTAAAPVNYINTASTTVWPGDATFQNHVAGIGRDDVEELNHKQSNSINSNINGQVLISLGAPAASNAANTSTFITDKSYLVWGDNGNTQSLATASTAFTYDIGPNWRMNRIWKAVSTDFSQPVQITIPQSMIGTGGNAGTTACQKLRLVVASDAGFTTIISATNNLTVSGTNYVCTYQFPAGTSYFTFGRVEIGAEGNVVLPHVPVTPSVSYSTCEEFGWRYWYEDGTQGLNNGTKKIFAINRNGNGNAATLNNFTGSIAWQDGPWEVTNGKSSTHIMQRLLTINDPSAGSYATNGGMIVRFFIDPAEVDAAIFNPAVSSKWFKHPGDANATLADQTASTVNNAIFYPTLTMGVEDGINYVEYTGVTSFSTFGFASNEGVVTPLPVIYDRFDVNQRGNNAYLSWRTSFEQNSSRFEIERSTNNINYQKVGVVSAAGNSSSSVDYNYTDALPKDISKIYYRLKQVDKDGRYAYSSVRQLSVEINGIQWKVYPTRFRNSLTLDVSTGITGAIQISLTDMNGRQVYTHRQSVAGNHFVVTLTDVSGIAPGNYILTLKTEKDVASMKVIKQE